MNQTYMKEKPILPLILSMSLPMMLSMMVNSLYNIIDSIFVAKLGEDAMTAISLVYPIQNLIIAISVGFGIAANAMIAFYLGASKRDKADEVGTHSMTFNILHGVIFTIVGLLIMPHFLGLFTSDSKIIGLGISYSNIVLWFSVIIMAGITFEKLFQSEGKMMISMISMIVGCVVNIILDPIMIFGLGPIPAMGIKGAAWATGIGQAVTFLIYLVYYLKGYINVRLRMKYVKPNKSILGRLYFIGIPAALNLALPSLLVSALNGILASFSSIYVVVLGVYYKLQTFIYLPANGIIQGMRPILSYNYGAGEDKRVKKIYKLSLTLIVGMMFIGMILCFVIPKQLIGLFTDSTETINAGVLALRIISMGFVISAFSVTSSGALEALGKGVESLIISLLRYVILIIPIAFILSKVIGVTGVWNAFWITEVITAIVVSLLFGKLLFGKRK